MTLKRWLGSLLLMITLTGCSRGEVSKVYGFEDDDVETIHIDSIMTPPGYFCTNRMIRGKQHIIVTDVYTNRATFIPIDDVNRKWTISFASELVGKVRTLDVVDSQLVIFTRGTEADNQLHLFDLSGTHLKRFEYGDYLRLNLAETKVPLDSLQEVYSSNESPVQVWGGDKILFAVNPGNLIHSDKLLAASLDMKTNAFIEHDIDLPDHYDDAEQMGNRFYVLPQILVVEETAYISFPSSGDIVKYNLRQNQESDRKNAPSKYFENLTSPPSNSNAQGKEKGAYTRFVMETGRYGQLIYLRNSQKFVRLIFPPSEKGESRAYTTERFASLMLLDLDLNVLAESKVYEGFGEGGIFTLAQKTSSGLSDVIYLQDMQETGSLQKKNGDITFSRFIITEDSLKPSSNGKLSTHNANAFNY